MMRAHLISLALVALAPLTPAAADQAPRVPASEARAAGETLGRWAAAEGETRILSAAIELALSGGASLDPDDPWSLADLATALAAAPDGAARLAEIAAMSARGVVAGVSRSEISLAPGQTETIALRMADGERALVEARLKRGPEGADLDLRVLSQGGLVAEAVGPETGRAGIGALVYFTPKNCLDVSVELTNAGSAVANAVLLAPASAKLGCGE